MGVKNTPSQDHRGGYTRSYIRTPGGIGQALALAGDVLSHEYNSMGGIRKSSGYPFDTCLFGLY
jgi:hypothetical protein